MTTPINGVWTAEQALNEKWTCVRYRHDSSIGARGGVRRDVYGERGHTFYFDTEAEAISVCKKLNLPERDRSGEVR